jgi:glycosyltransferase involved in cell wall biosynthesis
LFENVPNLQAETVRDCGAWDPLAPRRIASLIRRFGADIVHTQLKRAAWHGGRGARLAGVPVVSKLHNYVQLDRYRYVHTLIGTTEDQKAHALSNGWPEERLVVIPNFSRVPPAGAVRGPREAGRPVQLLSYGRYVHKKGFDVLLKSFRQVLDDGVDAHLTIGGSGPEADSLTALAERLGVQDSVSLNVWIDDVSESLDRSDLFVLPSRDEPFGIVMLEAMARGVPIVTTRTQGPVQVLSDKTAYFAETGSEASLYASLTAALCSPDEACERAGRALQLYRSEYYEDAVLPRLEALYRDILSS